MQNFPLFQHFNLSFVEVYRWPLRNLLNNCVKTDSQSTVIFYDESHFSLSDVFYPYTVLKSNTTVLDFCLNVAWKTEWFKTVSKSEKGTKLLKELSYSLHFTKANFFLLSLWITFSILNLFWFFFNNPCSYNEHFICSLFQSLIKYVKELVFWILVVTNTFSIQFGV